jgi:soluble cytochrome b562
LQLCKCIVQKKAIKLQLKETTLKDELGAQTVALDNARTTLELARAQLTAAENKKKATETKLEVLRQEMAKLQSFEQGFDIFAA